LERSRARRYYIHAFIRMRKGRGRWFPIGNSYMYIHIRTRNKGLCIFTHIFNLENGYPRNNPVAFSSSPGRSFSSPGPNGRFSFPRVFSSPALAIYLTPVFPTSDALWNRNVPFSFFTSDTRDYTIAISTVLQ